MTNGIRLAVAVCITALVGAAWPSWKPVAAAPQPGILPERLADTGLGDRRVRVFSPQYPLWSDGMTKRRWISLPPGGVIDASTIDDWKFPVGTKLWKEFALNGHKVETRMLWKASEAGWVPATYVWDEAGGEARLAPDGGVPAAVDLGNGRRHSIPARTDCAACHGTEGIRPLGLNPLQLSDDRDPNALHGEPLPAGAMTLRALRAAGQLTGLPREFAATPPRIQTTRPDTRTVLGYLSTNCGVCHNGRGEIAAMAPVFTLDELLRDGDAVANRMLQARTKFQLPGSNGSTVLLHAGAPELSALFFRMRSRSPSSQMPPLGTVVRDQQAVDTVDRWIRSMAPGSSASH